MPLPVKLNVIVGPTAEGWHGQQWRRTTQLQPADDAAKAYVNGELLVDSGALAGVKEGDALELTIAAAASTKAAGK